MLIYIVVLEEQSSMQIMRSSVLKLASISKNWAGLRLVFNWRFFNGRFSFQLFGFAFRSFRRVGVNVIESVLL